MTDEVRYERVGAAAVRREARAGVERAGGDDRALAAAPEVGDRFEPDQRLGLPQDVPIFWLTAATALSTSPTSLKNPVSPSVTTSGMPPTREAITGTSHAIASRAARHSLSARSAR